LAFPVPDLSKNNVGDNPLIVIWPPLVVSPTTNPGLSVVIASSPIITLPLNVAVVLFILNGITPAANSKNISPFSSIFFIAKFPACDECPSP